VILERMADSEKPADTTVSQNEGGDGAPRVKSEKELKKEKAKQEKLAKFQAKQEKLAAQKQQTKKEGEVTIKFCFQGMWLDFKVSL
jgi:valyl-tRNA synthetase